MMSDIEWEVRVEGIEELADYIRKLGRISTDNIDQAEAVYRSGADIIADDMRGRVSRGSSGNLQKSVTTKTLQRRGSQPAPAIAAIDRKRAPHAHLVEFGTSTRKVKKKKVLYDKKTGQFFGAQVAEMPAKPFFRPAVDAKENEVFEHVISGMLELIEGVK
jgi:HK97 gp10 family phage protein